ncbi:LamG domain-containing protein [Altererythrobacter sp. ZODW24]|uniref:LamG domain-containing protein n=1 Tax=Altererythrobacter sp. ZODW24 TaxID=2185142 RepID=UPI000DF75432|nr:LamG domain-containing protein [Altererythrobacter sp. ZODW24]
MNKNVIRISALGLVLATASACSQDTSPAVVTEDGYALDTLRLDGTESLAFDANPALEPAEQATLEFWVQAAWDSDPGYDPVVVSSAGAEGPAYLVAIQRERDGVTLASGDQLDSAPFDFSDGKLHHVALVDYGNTTTLMIDQKAIAELQVDLQPVPSEGLYIGTARGGDDAFTGAIGGLRLWNVAVDPANLGAYRLKDVNDANAPHPDIDHLALISDFQNERIIYGE